MLDPVTITIIMTTVGWPVSAFMGKFFSEMYESTKKHLRKRKSEIQSVKAEKKDLVEDGRPRSMNKKKKKIQSVKTEQKNSVEDQRPRSTDKKNELHELKELRREVLKAADILTNQLEPVLRQVELMIANCAEHGTIDETCPGRSKTPPEQITKKSTSETKSSNGVCTVCSALERIRTNLVSGFASAELVLDMATKLKQIIESSTDEGPHKVRQREPRVPAPPNGALAVTELEPKPKPQPLESTGAEIGCRPKLSEAVRKLKQTRVEEAQSFKYSNRRPLKLTNADNTELLNPRLQLLSETIKERRQNGAAKSQLFDVETRQWLNHDYSFHFPNVRKLDQTWAAESQFLKYKRPLKRTSSATKLLSAGQLDIETLEDIAIYTTSSGLTINFIWFILFIFFCVFFFFLLL